MTVFGAAATGTEDGASGNEAKGIGAAGSAAGSAVGIGAADPPAGTVGAVAGRGDSGRIAGPSDRVARTATGTGCCGIARVTGAGCCCGSTWAAVGCRATTPGASAARLAWARRLVASCGNGAGAAGSGRAGCWVWMVIAGWPSGVVAMRMVTAVPGGNGVSSFRIKVSPPAENCVRPPGSGPTTLASTVWPERCCSASSAARTSFAAAGSAAGSGRPSTCATAAGMADMAP